MADLSQQEGVEDSPENGQREPKVDGVRNSDEKALPTERERLLTQIDSEKKQTDRKKRRKSARRRRADRLKKEKSTAERHEPRAEDKKVVSQDAKEDPNQGIPSEEKAPKVPDSSSEKVEESGDRNQPEKSKKKRRRRRPRRKPKPLEKESATEEKIVPEERVTPEEKSVPAPTPMKTEEAKAAELPPEDVDPVAKEPTESVVSEEIFVEEETGDEVSSQPAFATGFDEDISEEPVREVDVSPAEDELPQPVEAEEKAFQGQPEEVIEETTQPGEIFGQPEEPLEKPEEIREQPEEVTVQPEELKPQPEEVTVQPEELKPQPEEMTVQPEEPKPQPEEVTVEPEVIPEEQYAGAPPEDPSLQTQPTDVFEDIPIFPDEPAPSLDEDASIAPDSDIEIVSEPQELEKAEDATPMTLQKAKEEEKRLTEKYQETPGKVAPEVIPTGEPELEVVQEGDAVESRSELQGAESAEKIEETPEEIQKKVDEKKAELNLDETLLTEKKSFFDSLRGVMEELSPVLGKVFNMRIIGGIIAMIVLVMGGMWVYSSNFFGLFDGNGYKADGPYAAADGELLREYGFTAHFLFGGNDGSVSDALPVSIRITDYFGTLSEPRIEGETGISAATYYGGLFDEREIVNQFVEYVRNLAMLQNLYSIDVYSMLDQTTARDRALFDYLDQLRDAQEESTRVKQAVLVNIDDLKLSYNSISDDKDSLETDFFAALNDLEPEKSDLLLKSFVDVSQKQLALKARVAALEKVSSFYDIALQQLDERINAVDSNKQALIQGIRVVEVPGASDLDIIIRP